MMKKIVEEKSAIEVEKKEIEAKKSQHEKSKDGEADPLITYLTLKSEQHNSKLDRTYVESVFESYSTKQTVQDDQLEQVGATGQQISVLTKENTQTAVFEVFQMWKVELSDSQKTRLLDVYFKQTWEKIQEDGILELKDSYRFIKDLMTTAVVKKNTTTKAVQITNSTQPSKAAQESANPFAAPLPVS